MSEITGAAGSGGAASAEAAATTLVATAAAIIPIRTAIVPYLSVTLNLPSPVVPRQHM
ncbi:hypothetical protein KRMM14A1004_21830 [Krasilnikovia sp. MM14-A1004]